MAFLHLTSLLHLIKHIALSIANIFSKRLIFTIFSLFLLVCEVLHISNKYGVPNKSAKKSFYTCHFEKSNTPRCPLFTTFLLVFMVGEVRNISSKYRRNKSARYWFFQTRDLISFFISPKKRLSMQRYFKTSTF